MGYSVIDNWLEFQRTTPLTRPQNEAEYAALVDLSHHLIDTHNCDEEPYASLLDVVGTYMDAYERDHYPDLKAVDTEPHHTLAFLMEQQNVSQYQLEKEGVAAQSALSNILAGKRGISKALAKRLAERFGVSI